MPTRAPKALADLPVGVVEALSLWGIWRAMGFPADAIFVGHVASAETVPGARFPQGPRVGELIPADCPHLEIRLDAGGRSFRVHYPEPSLTAAEFVEVWGRAAALWQSATVVQRRAIMHASWMGSKRVELLMAMHRKGIPRPPG